MNDPDVQAKVDMLAKVFRGRLHVRYGKMNEAFAQCEPGPCTRTTWRRSSAHWPHYKRQLRTIGETMDKSTVFSKTAKGMTEFRAGGKSLAREPARVLALINGKSSILDFINSGALLDGKYGPVLESLLAQDLIRVFEQAKIVDTIEWHSNSTSGQDADFSDTLPVLTVQELSPAGKRADLGSSQARHGGIEEHGILFLRQQDGALAEHRRHGRPRTGDRR